MLWTLTETNDTVAADLSAELRVSKVMGELLSQRDLVTVEAAEEFLRPRLAQLDNPFALKNLRAAVTRIEQAIEATESGRRVWRLRCRWRDEHRAARQYAAHARAGSALLCAAAVG